MGRPADKTTLPLAQTEIQYLERKAQQQAAIVMQSFARMIKAKKVSNHLVHSRLSLSLCFLSCTLMLPPLLPQLGREARKAKQQFAELCDAMVTKLQACVRRKIAYNYRRGMNRRLKAAIKIQSIVRW